VSDLYRSRYSGKDFYWGVEPSSTCLVVAEVIPSGQGMKLLDIGCGEGRNAVFFASMGFEVTAFDLAPEGIRKTEILAERAGVSVRTFVADMREYRIQDTFHVIFSTGVLQYLPHDVRKTVIDGYRDHTEKGGINAHSVFVHKPFLQKPPDAEDDAHSWLSGELTGYYNDWRIEYTTEEIFNCNSGGIPHEHAVSRMVARKV